MVVVIAGAAIALYQTLGFIVTMSLLVFTLLVVDRAQAVCARRLASAHVLLSLFGTALKSPLDRVLVLSDAEKWEPVFRIRAY